MTAGPVKEKPAVQNVQRIALASESTAPKSITVRLHASQRRRRSPSTLETKKTVVDRTLDHAARVIKTIRQALGHGRHEWLCESNNRRQKGAGKISFTLHAGG